MKRKPINKRMKDALLACYLRPDRPGTALAVRAAKLNFRKEGLAAPWADSTLRRWLDGYVRANSAVVAAARV